MEVKEDPKERHEQIKRILDDPNCKVEETIKLYDQWYIYYDQVSGMQNYTLDNVIYGTVLIVLILSFT